MRKKAASADLKAYVRTAPLLTNPTATTKTTSAKISRKAGSLDKTRTTQGRPVFRHGNRPPGNQEQAKLAEIGAQGGGWRWEGGTPPSTERSWDPPSTKKKLGTPPGTERSQQLVTDVRKLNLEECKWYFSAVSVFRLALCNIGGGAS